MDTNTMFGTPGHPMTWGPVLPSWNRRDRRSVAARPQSLSAAYLTIDDCRSVRERIPDR